MSNDDSTKCCTGCGETKPLTEFYKRTDCSSRKSKCRACYAEYSQSNKEHIAARGRKYRQANKDRIAARRREYYITNRVEMLGNQKQRDAERKEEIAAYQRRYREAHKDEARAYMAAYWPDHYAANREKYIEKGKERQRRLYQGHESRHKRSDVRKKLEEQNGRCYWCDEPLPDYYEVDHIIPVSKGGSDAPGNICCACFTCNRRKHNKMPYEFSDRLF